MHAALDECHQADVIDGIRQRADEPPDQQGGRRKRPGGQRNDHRGQRRPEGADRQGTYVREGATRPH